MIERYTLEEVKQLFKDYRKIERSEISDNEYILFCDAIHILPKDIVDKVNKEIDFILLSAKPKKANAACFYFLEDEDIKNKKGFIIITPIIFGFGINLKAHAEDVRLDILHEIAHFHLGHKKYLDQEDYERKEKEAKDQVDKWYINWIRDIDVQEVEKKNDEHQKQMGINKENNHET